jgi:hypothetical protein
MCSILHQHKFSCWGLSRHLSYIHFSSGVFMASNRLVPLMFFPLVFPPDHGTSLATVR